MRLLRGLVALVVAVGLVLSVGVVAPDEALAAEIVADGSNFACSADGLASAVGAANGGDTITFDCGDLEEIEFSDGDLVTIDKTLTINGITDDDPIILDGNDATNFFGVTATGELILENLTLAHGAAENGGAIYIETGGSLRLQGNVEFEENAATDHDEEAPIGNGGAIYVEPGGSVTAVDSVDFERNSAASDGGAIYLAGDETELSSSLTIYNSYFSDNDANDGGGGAIYSGPGNTVTIVSSEFEYNRANGDGGYGAAILVDDGVLTIRYSEFYDNIAGALGGAIFVSQTQLDIDRSAIGYNNADDDGGALAIAFDSEATITQGLLYFNHSENDGGAIAIENGASLSISRSTFDSNAADDTGGAISNNDAELKINASTFAGNGSDFAGSTIYTKSDSDSEDTVSTDISWSTIVQFDNAQFTPALYSDTALTLTGVILDGFGEHCEIEDDSPLTYSYSLSNDESCGFTANNSQQNIDPGLADFETPEINGLYVGYFPLESNSPAIDAGPTTCDTDVQDGLDTDQLGNQRPFGTNCTIGAIEVNNLPPEINDLAETVADIYEGVTGDMTILASDRTEEDSDGPITYAVDCDISDGIMPVFSENSTVRCTFPDNGYYDAELLVSDGLATSSRPFRFNVLNVAPVMTGIDAGTSASLNTPFNFTMHATDVPADTVIFVYTCGNGTDAYTAEIGSDTGDFSAQGICTYTQDGNYTVSAVAIDDDYGISDPPMTAEVSVITFHSTLCANNWTGQVRYLDGGGCGRGETLIQLPDDGPISLCVNNWNGATQLGSDCGRSEHIVIVDGDGSIDVCVNQWNGSMRVGGQCSRSEIERQL